MVQLHLETDCEHRYPADITTLFFTRVDVLPHIFRSSLDMAAKCQREQTAKLNVFSVRMTVMLVAIQLVPR
jgi:hypothetical protein